MTRHRKCGTIRKCVAVSRPFFATKMAASTCGWTDRTTSALLEALKIRESLWNTKCESYENRNTKKKHYDEIVVILKEDCAHGGTHHLPLRFLRFTTSLIIRNAATVEPLLSGHPLLSGQLLKSRNYCQYNTVNKTPFKRSPLLSDRGHFSAVPMSVLLLFLPLFSGQ